MLKLGLRNFYRPQTEFAKVMFSQQVFACPQGGLCPQGRSLSRGVSVHGGLCPGGSLSRGCLCSGVSVLGVSVRGSMSRGSLSVWGGSLSGRPPHMVMCRQYTSYWNAFLLMYDFRAILSCPCQVVCFNFTV